MPYGHLIAATVMTLGLCQGRSSIASFSILTSASRGPFVIAELLVRLAIKALFCYLWLVFWLTLEVCKQTLTCKCIQQTLLKTCLEIESLFYVVLLVFLSLILFHSYSYLHFSLPG